MNGIDISAYQRGLNLANVPCDFVIVKATEGTSLVQDTCDPWVQAAKALGKCWGFYHFMAGGDPVAEADWFVDNCAGYFGEGIPVLDYEQYGRIGTDGAKRFLDRVYERTKVRCLVYTSRSVLTEEDWSAIAPNHGLWVAQYANNEPTGYQEEPWLPGGGFGADWTLVMHQYSSTGRLAGWDGNLDINKAYINREQWGLYATGDRETKPPLPEALQGFSDLDSEAWYIDAIDEAVNEGYMTGYGDGRFGPNDALTRGQAVCAISKMADAELYQPFSDVTASPYYYAAVEWAKQNGVVSSEQEAFRPDDPCTRAEFVTMLCNWHGVPMTKVPSGITDWDDVPDWAKNQMSWACEFEIIQGNDGKLRPNDPTTRAEAAAMMARL